MIVYNTEPLGYSAKAQSLWEDKGLTYKRGSWDEVDKNLSFGDVQVLIVRLQRKVTGEILDKFPDLQYVVSATTGHDHIDIEALKKREVKLISLRGHNNFLNTIPSTAEHTWALLMSLLRNIPSANADVQKGFWNRDKFKGLQLQAKTIGIVGYGRTGRKVALYADAFNMEVLYYDPYVTESLPGHKKMDSLETLLSSSDIISLHVHLNEETEELLNAEKIALAKPGSFLINTSRGKILNEKAVYEAIYSGKLAGVATDVLASELEDVSNSILWKAQQEGLNIIITPHIGGATWDAMNACEEFIVGTL